MEVIRNYTVRSRSGLWVRLRVDGDDVVLSYVPRVVRSGMVVRTIGASGLVLDEHALTSSVPEDHEVEVCRVVSSSPERFSAWIAAHVESGGFDVMEAADAMMNEEYRPVGGRIYRCYDLFGFYDSGRLLVDGRMVDLTHEEIGVLWPDSSIGDPRLGVIG